MYASQIVGRELARTFYGSMLWAEMAVEEQLESVGRFAIEASLLPDLAFNTILRMRQGIDVSDPELASV